MPNIIDTGSLIEQKKRDLLNILTQYPVNQELLESILLTRQETENLSRSECSIIARNTQSSDLYSLPLPVLEQYYLFLITLKQSKEKTKEKNVCRRCQDITNNGKNICEDCYKETTINCYNCGIDIKPNNYRTYFYPIEGEAYCEKCFRDNFYHCDTCGVNRKSKETKICKNCNVLMCANHLDNHRCWDMIFRPFNKLTHISSKPKQYLTTDRIVGVELEVVNGNPKNISIGIPNDCGISQDGSLHGSNPIEIQTPPAQGEALEDILFKIENVLKKADYEVNKTCGLHIHFDPADFKNNAKKIRQIINTYYAIEPVIFAMLPENRRNNKYAMPLANWFSPSKIMELLSQERISMPKIEENWYKTMDRYEVNNMKRGKYDNSRYHGLNLHNLFCGKSLELRYHHGTIDTKEIINWINFNAKIIDWALRHYDSDKLVNIRNATKMTDKFRKVVSYLELDQNTERYIRKNIIKNSK